VTGVVLVGLAALLLPAAPTAGDVPADLVWAFRLRSLAGTTACWATLGLVFAALVPAALNDREPARV
ncbi:MAG: CbtA family protein, partial [Actinomycetota bacterium]|nr:CbtA family protein [Actinomycetota bacterium]